MRKRTIILLLMLLPGLVGCWDRTEIEDAAFVSSLGIDLDGNEYRFIFRVVEPEKLTTGMMSALPGDPGKLAAGNIAVRANSLEQAIKLVQPSMARILSLDHVRWIGVSDALAQKGLTPVVDQLLRHNQIRRGASLYVILGQDAIKPFLVNRPVADTNSIKFFEGLRLVQKRFHLGPPLQLQHFHSRLMAEGVDPMVTTIKPNMSAMRSPDSPLPPVDDRSFHAGETPRAGGNPVEHLGTAVFHGDRLAGVLSVDEGGFVLALRGEMGKLYFTLDDPREEGQVITLRVHQENKPQYRTAFVGGKPRVHVRLQFEGEILSSSGKTDYSLPQNRRALEDYMGKYFVNKGFNPLLEKVYRQWGSDPAGFGQLFRTKFPTSVAWRDYNWRTHVKDLAVTVEATMMIRRFGMLLENPDITRGK
jgi:spore germination protein KC